MRRATQAHEGAQVDVPGDLGRLGQEGDAAGALAAGHGRDRYAVQGDPAAIRAQQAGQAR